MIYSCRSFELEFIRDDIQKADRIPQITLQAQDITYARDIENSLEYLLKK